MPVAVYSVNTLLLYVEYCIGLGKGDVWLNDMRDDKTKGKVEGTHNSQNLI